MISHTYEMIVKVLYIKIHQIWLKQYSKSLFIKISNYIKSIFILSRHDIKLKTTYGRNSHLNSEYKRVRKNRIRRTLEMTNYLFLIVIIHDNIFSISNNEFKNCAHSKINEVANDVH